MPDIRVLIIGVLSFCSAVAAPGETSDRSSVNEHLGRKIPSGIFFRDEKGDKIPLDSVIRRPTIVSLVYFRCPNVCPVILGDLAEALTKVQLRPQKDYQLVTVSFDPADTPDKAATIKNNYTTVAENYFPEQSWKFLTGDEKNILKFTEAVGFNFKRAGAGFTHPKVLIFLSPEKKIVRYLYGKAFNPFELKIALAEASAGQKLLKAILFSYEYDRSENRYVFNLPKALLAILLASLFSLAIFMLITKALKPRRV